MGKNARHRCLIVAIALFMVALQTSAFAAAHRRVLILYSYNDLMPWQARIHAALQERLEQIDPDARPDVYEERLDSTRLDASVSGALLVAYLRDKYAGLTFDTVIAESTAATHLLLAHPDLFATARRYAIDPGVVVPTPASGIEVIQSQGDWAMGSLQTLAAVMPDLRRVVVVIDASLVGQANKRKLLAAAPPALPPGVALDVWDDFSFAELADRSTRLPPGSVLFYTPVFQDRTGAHQTPISVLQSLTKSASVPVFAYHDLYLGQGIVGGRLLSAQRFGIMMADLALGPGHAERWARGEASLTPVMFDDAQLRRWGIPDSRLPAGAIVVGREPPGLWRYRVEIGLALAALVAEAGLILWLMRALQQRDRAVRDVIRERDGLEIRVAERTQDLVVAKGRLEVNNAHLQDLADTDALTGLTSRRKFLATLEDEWRRADRDGSDLALLMLDIDRFKAVNDGHGHVAGDCVIQAFADICRIQLPLQGCIGRLGGEEFAIVLPGASVAHARACAERIRGAVKASPVTTDSGPDISVTVSIGVSRRLGPSDTPAALMVRADEALYEAKRHGRDRVVCRAESDARQGRSLQAVATG
ncbi:MAG: diguanylate cyclase [Janthinobacterium lividum]